MHENGTWTFTSRWCDGWIAPAAHDGADRFVGFARTSWLHTFVAYCGGSLHSCVGCIERAVEGCEHDLRAVTRARLARAEQLSEAAPR